MSTLTYGRAFVMFLSIYEPARAAEHASSEMKTAAILASYGRFGTPFVVRRVRLWPRFSGTTVSVSLILTTMSGLISSGNGDDPK